MSSGRRRIPLRRLAWRNTLRNKRRTLLTVSAVMVAVAALTYGQAHINGLLNNLLDTYARTESGHVRIREEGYTERARFLPLHLNIQHLADLLPVVRSTPGVAEALPRIRTAVLVDGAKSNRPGLLLGIDLAREEGYLNPSAMAQVGRLPEPGRPEVMVGREFAEELAVSVGDTITLLGQTAYRSLGGARLAVTGLAVSGMAYFDNTFLIAPLDQVQAMVDLQDATTEVVVFATDPERADELAQRIRGELGERSANPLEVLSWRDQGEIVRMLDMVKPVLGVVLFLLLLMACLIIVNTMLMTVMERTQEFGMQAALGMRRSDIVKLILAEGVAIGLLGAIAGAALGSAVGLWLEYTGINVAGATRAIDLPFQGILYPDWKVSYVLFATAAGMIAAGLAAIYPAWRAVRRTPAEALRA